MLDEKSLDNLGSHFLSGRLGIRMFDCPSRIAGWHNGRTRVMNENSRSKICFHLERMLGVLSGIKNVTKRTLCRVTCRELLALNLCPSPKSWFKQELPAGTNCVEKTPARKGIGAI